MLPLSKTQSKIILFPDVGSVKVGRFYAILFCYIDVESTSYSLLLGEKACFGSCCKQFLSCDGLLLILLELLVAVLQNYLADYV